MNKLKAIFKKKNLNPMNNRKKVGIILFATSIGLFFLFASRLTYIVAVGKVAGFSLSEKTKELYTETSVVKAKRGAILDRNGQVIAEDATSYSIYAIVSKDYKGAGGGGLYAQEEDYKKIADILDEYTDISKEHALETLKDNKDKDGNDKFQVEFGVGGNDISLETKEKIEEKMEKSDLSGIFFTGHPARIYPNGVFASHVIGYTQLKDTKDDSKGLEGVLGIEETYDNILNGTDGKIEYEKDVKGNPVPGTVITEKKAVNGKDVYTTLDVRFQNRLEMYMDSVYEKYDPEDMTAMLMEASTGNIVAMSQRATFNPETKEGINDNWKNMLVYDTYEPGSTMKLFTIAAAIQEGKFNPDETFVYPVGGFQVGDKYFNDHDKGAKGTLTFRQALSWSSNVGMLTLEQRLTGEKWVEYLNKFGFGQSTNSGFSSEAVGKLPEDNSVDQAVSSFGQSIEVTNFQMMQAFTAIANEGTMIKPQYISKIVDNNTGEEQVTEVQTVGEQIITAQAASDIRTYMIDTVEDPVYGVAPGIYAVPDYHIAAKTGTAEISGGPGYLAGTTDYIYSVVEMIPADKPEYILYLTMKRPQKSQDTIKYALSEIANPLLKVVMSSTGNVATTSEE